MLVGGVLMMGASGLAHGRIDAPTIAIALANSLVIAVYSVIDGQRRPAFGRRRALGFRLQFLGGCADRDRLRADRHAPARAGGSRRVPRDWRRGLAGGLAAFVGYAVVIWAMTQAPIATVAALRETSVVFASLIGVILLGEPFQTQRAVAALVILAGVVVLRLG